MIHYSHLVGCYFFYHYNCSPSGLGIKLLYFLANFSDGFSAHFRKIAHHLSNLTSFRVNWNVNTGTCRIKCHLIYWTIFLNFFPQFCVRLAWTPHPLYGLVGPTKYDPTGTVAASSASSLTLRLPVPEQKEILILFFRKKIWFSVYIVA